MGKKTITYLGVLFIDVFIKIENSWFKVELNKLSGYKVSKMILVDQILTAYSVLQKYNFFIRDHQ